MRQSASALMALADDAMPAPCGNVLTESICTCEPRSQGNRSPIRSKKVRILASKAGRGQPSYITVRPGKAASTLTSTVIFVRHLASVKLSDGLRGSWMPCLPQYLTRAILEGD